MNVYISAYTHTHTHTHTNTHTHKHTHFRIQEDAEMEGRGWETLPGFGEGSVPGFSTCGRAVSECV